MKKKINYIPKIENYIIDDDFSNENYALVEGEQGEMDGYTIEKEKLKDICQTLRLDIVPVDEFIKDFLGDKYVEGLIGYYKSQYVLRKKHDDGVGLGYKGYIIELDYLANEKDKKEIFVVNSDEYKETFDKIFNLAGEKLKDGWFKRKKNQRKTTSP